MKGVLAFSVLAALAGCARDAVPDESGLLIGLSSGRTLWIAPRLGTLQVAATKQALLIPRADGFWWTGRERRCTVSEYNGEGVNIDAGIFVSRVDALWLTRAGDTARVTLDGTDCADAERDAMRRRAVAATAQADSAAARGDSTGLAESRLDTLNVPEDIDCSRNTQRITFASPSALSVETRYVVTEYCSPGKYYTSGSNAVIPFDTAQRVTLRPVLSDAQWAELTKPPSDSSACGFEEERTPGHLDSAWAVVRSHGKWVAGFFIDGPIVCRGGEESNGGSEFELPASFTGSNALPVEWEELEKRIPQLRDAAASPSGRQIVMLAGDTLSIVSVRGGKLGKSLLKVAVGSLEELVMVRWATGRELAEWTRVIPALAEPRVLVRDPGVRE
jgi:hypothetical protein